MVTVDGCGIKEVLVYFLLSRWEKHMFKCTWEGAREEEIFKINKRECLNHVYIMHSSALSTLLRMNHSILG